MAACVRDRCRLHTADPICGLCGAITGLNLSPSGQQSEYSSTETQQDDNKPSGAAEALDDVQVIAGVIDHQADANNTENLKAGAQVPDVVRSQNSVHVRDVQGVSQLNGDQPGHMARTPRGDANINKSDSETRDVPLSGSSESYIRARESEPIQPLTKKKHTRQPNTDRAGMAPIATDSSCEGSSRHIEIARTVIRDMNKYGVCVIDKFLGPHKGVEILKDVLQLKDKEGAFSEGQVVRKKTEEIIRGDLITWVDGTEPGTRSIGQLISHIDAVISLCVGKLGGYNLHGRTSAMVACYPGGGRHYIRHVDNPNKDGRCITCIYYLNKHWNVKVDGGLLKIYPQCLDQVAQVEPLLDRLLFFWSDRRNPHEVLPAFKDRYAITVWYFDKEEREEARKRFKEQERSSAN